MISSAIAGLAALILVHALFKRFARPSLTMIRGPKSPSFIVGRVISLRLLARCSLPLFRKLT